MTRDNISNEDFQKLKAVSLKRANKAIGGDLWAQWHDLADTQHQAAKEFFIERLEDSRSAWREVSISLLGFHYDLEQVVVEKIRALLTSDPVSDVRLAAAGVLGHQSKLPEKALVQALAHDSNLFVRKAAFSSLLELAEVPYKIRLNELEKIDSGEVTPNLEHVKRILLECQKTTAVDMIKE
jgi:hypothetical protein